MKEARSSSKSVHTAWRSTETLLFGFALLMVIPPVPSDAAQRYSAIPALMIGGAAFVLHLAIKIWRKEESTVYALAKAAIYALLVIGVNRRVFM